MSAAIVADLALRVYIIDKSNVTCVWAQKKKKTRKDKSVLSTNTQTMNGNFRCVLK